MPAFSQTSKDRLSSCDGRLQLLFNEVIKHHDCTILEGHRGEYEQNQAYSNKRSQKKWPESKHNTVPSLAVDVAPYPVDWENTRRFDLFAGIVLGIASQLGLKIRWGGDWDGDRNPGNQRFNDLPHFEIIE